MILDVPVEKMLGGPTFGAQLIARAMDARLGPGRRRQTNLSLLGTRGQGLHAVACAGKRREGSCAREELRRLGGRLESVGLTRLLFENGRGDGD
jgi:hypothetical protein